MRRSRRRRKKTPAVVPRCGYVAAAAIPRRTLSILHTNIYLFHLNTTKLSRSSMARVSLAILALVGATAPTAAAFQLPKLELGLPTFGAPAATDLENQLLAEVQAVDRLSNSEGIDRLVAQLESSGLGIERPAIAPEVYGQWRLVHTSSADTASPIQRKAVDASKYNIYQNIELDDSTLIVSQVVKFGPESQLKVDALASTAAYPLAELTERKSSTTLGLNILGVSLVGEEAKPDPNRPDSRIDFVFDSGSFNLRGATFPYPVPFRIPILRDVVKGWIDITYLSGRIRIARGNKGTTFVLLKEDSDQ